MFVEYNPISQIRFGHIIMCAEKEKTCGARTTILMYWEALMTHNGRTYHWW